MSEDTGRRRGASIVAVVAAVIARDDLYLVCKRPAGKHHAGLWEFPGGKVRRGETDAAALGRELREELGLRVTHAGPPRCENVDADAGVTVTFHDVTVTGEPELLEHAAIGWYSVDVLMRMALAPSDACFVEDVLAGGTARRDR